MRIVFALLTVAVVFAVSFLLSRRLSRATASRVADRWQADTWKDPDDPDATWAGLILVDGVTLRVKHRKPCRRFTLTDLDDLDWYVTTIMERAAEVSNHLAGAR